MNVGKLLRQKNEYPQLTHLFCNDYQILLRRDLSTENQIEPYVCSIDQPTECLQEQQGFWARGTPERHEKLAAMIFPCSFMPTTPTPVLKLNLACQRRRPRVFNSTREVSIATWTTRFSTRWTMSGLELLHIINDPITSNLSIWNLFLNSNRISIIPDCPNSSFNQLKIWLRKLYPSDGNWFALIMFFSI